MFFTNGIRSVKTYGDRPEAFCQCWQRNRHRNTSTSSTPWKDPSECSCGEEDQVYEWGWEKPESSGTSWAVVSDDKKLVTFHPFYSSGTAAVKGDTPLVHNHHYYWEVKMITDSYGTDIMVGLGTNKVNIGDARFKFTSLLGQDKESYGLSYSGAVRHDGKVSQDSVGFCRGTIVGVRVDMWHGTIEFFINRKSQGTSFYNIKRHESLYPIVCSTAANSSMRLIYASSYRVSLLADAAKVLASSVKNQDLKLPPGLTNSLRSHFWLTLPSEGPSKPKVVISSEEESDSDSDSFVSDMVYETLKNPAAVTATNRAYFLHGCHPALGLDGEAAAAAAPGPSSAGAGPARGRGEAGRARRARARSSRPSRPTPVAHISFLVEPGPH